MCILQFRCSSLTIDHERAYAVRSKSIGHREHRLHQTSLTIDHKRAYVVPSKSIGHGEHKWHQTSLTIDHGWNR